MSILNAEEMYQWYVNDVIKRNDRALAFKEACKAYCETMPLEKIKESVKNFYELERQELGEPEKKDLNNDFELYQRNILYPVIMGNFRTHPKVAAMEEAVIAAEEKIAENGDDKELNKIIADLYPLFQKEIQEKKLEEKVWKNKLVYKATEFANRKIIGEDFEAEFAPEKDHGNCTKGITVSLYRAAKEFGLPLYQTNQDKEIVAHPKTLANQLENYQKTSESGLLKDIPNIKAGDIILLPNSKGELKHAMMVSGFNEQGVPLLLGYDGTQKNIPMYDAKDGTSRRGIALDVHAFIKDKVDEHNRKEIAQIIFLQQKSQSIK